MSEPLSYPVPWKLVAGLWPHILHGTPANIDKFSHDVAQLIQPEPVIEGRQNLPASPRFVLVANHYQRKGLWILHSAAVLTHAIRKHYGPADPPIRWVVTANWPPLQIGPLRLPSPGDWLLPRVARALSCYPVSFLGTKPAYTARSIRRILREVPQSNCPLGLFPEGVAGSAGNIVRPLPGVDRLLVHLARAGVPVLPAAFSENGGFLIRFGTLLTPSVLIAAPNAADLAMARVADLAR